MIGNNQTTQCNGTAIDKTRGRGLVHLFVVLLFLLSGMGNFVSAQSLAVAESAERITVTRGDKVVLVYNKLSPPVPKGIDPVYRRSGFLHPVASPNGLVVTETFPVDHPHQHGIFSAWVKTTYDGRPVDFWNLAGGTGYVAHERVVSVNPKGESVDFEVDLIHRATSTPPVDVLRERWKITAHEADGSYHCFDLETTQQAITDKPLIVNAYHYGGIALRGPVRWVQGKEATAAGELSSFVNSNGSDRIKGNHEHVQWVALTGTVDLLPVSIAVLSHTKNFRAPQAARLHPTKPYFCYSPCVDGEFIIDREHPYVGQYRFLVTDAPPDAKWLNEQWQAWCGHPEKGTREE